MQQTPEAVGKYSVEPVLPVYFLPGVLLAANDAAKYRVLYALKTAEALKNLSIRESAYRFGRRQTVRQNALLSANFTPNIRYFRSLRSLGFSYSHNY